MASHWAAEYRTELLSLCRPLKQSHECDPACWWSYWMIMMMIMMFELHSETCSGCIWLPVQNAVTIDEKKERKKNKWCEMSHYYHQKWFIMFMEVCALAVISRGKWEWSALYVVLQTQLSKEAETGRLLTHTLLSWALFTFWIQTYIVPEKYVWKGVREVWPGSQTHSLRFGLWSAYAVEPHCCYTWHEIKVFPFNWKAR